MDSYIILIGVIVVIKIIVIFLYLCIRSERNKRRQLQQPIFSLNQPIHASGNAVMENRQSRNVFVIPNIPNNNTEIVQNFEPPPSYNSLYAYSTNNDQL